ncbi:acyl-CoA dehydrogenase family protein, partial [Streptomyces sp. SAJ15]|uniref:acyl-CoA dehydrogenase family protein n=2 Tax=unclassified Streptomyces TaxID=2593676 RepID=UPI00135DB222
MNKDFDLYRPLEEHEMLRETVRALAEAKIAPFAAEVDEEGRFPQEALDALVASELHAVHVPE